MMTDADRLNDAEKLVESNSTRIPRDVLLALRFVFDLAREGLKLHRIVEQMNSDDDTAQNDTAKEGK